MLPQRLFLVPLVIALRVRMKDVFAIAISARKQDSLFNKNIECFSQKTSMKLALTLT